MKRNYKLGLVAVTAVAAASPLIGIIGTQSAFADYAPSSGDVVGVGSDTLQYMIDFLADGDAYGNAGFNTTGPKNKLINIDATADANARLAFDANGSNGNGNGGSGVCGAGSGGTGTADGSTGGPEATVGACVLNPTVVLRAGTQPVQRPNGSGAGVKALVGNITDSPTKATINFARASSAQHPASTAGLDSVVIGNENVVMISANGSSTAPTNAVALTTAQLTQIYSATGSTCTTWNQVGGSSTDKIIPIIPQAGSGTRSFFEGVLGLTDAQVQAATAAGCVTVGEENDPTAIATASTPADAIEPMSQGRLNMYLGDLGSISGGQGPSGGLGGGYFKDPSCAFDSNVAACGSTTTGAINSVTPPVRVIPSAASFNRNLFLYFRDSDIASTKTFQPGGSKNWLNTLFYNPCTAAAQAAGTCVTSTDAEGASVQYGPGGAPDIDTSTGVQAMLDAGVTPVDPDGAGSFVQGGA